MLLWIDQPAFYTTATLTQRWTDINGSVFVSTATKPRTGSASLQQASGAAAFYKTLGSDGGIAPSGAVSIFGVRYYAGAGMAATFSPFRITQGGSAQITLRRNLDGTISVLRGTTTVLGTTTFATSLSTWYFLQLHALIDPSVGTVDLYIDNVNQLSLTGQNTRATSSSTWNGFQLGGTGTGSIGLDGNSQYFSDIYVMDGSDGTANGQLQAFNTALGDRKVEYLAAEAGNGTHSDFATSSGSNHGALVDDGTSGPDGDTSYVQSGTPGHIDSFNLQPLTEINVTVDAVAPVYSLTKNDAGSKFIAMGLVIDGVHYSGETIQAPSQGTYSIQTEIKTASPATAVNFTPDEINGMQASIEVIA